MAGLLTRGLGWPVGFWSRYSPFGVLFCACIDGLTLWFWFFIFLIFHWFLHPSHSAFLSFVMTGHDLPGWGFVFTFREECTSRALVSHSFTGGSGVILSSFGSGCEFGRNMRVLFSNWAFSLGMEKVD